MYKGGDSKLSWWVSKNIALNLVQVESDTLEGQIGTFCMRSSLDPTI